MSIRKEDTTDMAGKKYKFRIDSKNKVGIKETSIKSLTQLGKRVTLTVALNNMFDASKQYVMQDNYLIPSEEVKIKKGKRNKAVYYLLDELSYLASVTVQFNKKGKVVEKLLTLYQPKYICNEEEIYCDRITSMIEKEKREEIIEMLLPYILGKVG